MADVKQVVTHSLARFLSVSCVALVLAGISWAVYAGMIKPVLHPNETTDQNADQIVNPHQHPEAHFGGCASMRVIEYYRKDKP